MMVFYKLSLGCFEIYIFFSTIVHYISLPFPGSGRSLIRRRKKPDDNFFFLFLFLIKKKKKKKGKGEEEG